MLKEILQCMLSDGLTSKKQIAEKIGVQPETLDDMLRLLVKRGMLKVSECEPVEQPKCASCPISESGCTSDIWGQAYYVTDRGRRYAQQ